MYGNYSASFYGVILKIVKSEDIAEEVLQDAFLKIWDKISSYDAKKGRLFTWMINVTRNLAIDKVRSKAFINQNKTNDIANNVSIEDKGYSEKNNPEFIGVKDMLDVLNPDQKNLLDLMYFQGYSQTEIAKEFGIPLGTVKTKVRSAIMKLRTLF